MATRNVRNNLSHGTRTGSNIGSNIGKFIGGLIGWIITAVKETVIVFRLVWLCIACALFVAGLFAFSDLCLNTLGFTVIIVIFVGLAVGIGVVLTINRECPYTKPVKKARKPRQYNEYHFATAPDGTRKPSYSNSNTKKHKKSSSSNYYDEYRFVKERR